MAYFAPYIDETGFHMPTYTDIRDQLVLNAQEIFGVDLYLARDSQDYQWISSVASMIYDSFLLGQQVYNSRGPGTAIGIGLDGIVKNNGIKRKPATSSTCYVELTGIAGTTITNGVIEDVNGNSWNLNPTVILDGTGTATTLATCTVTGPVAVEIGQLNKIVTPTYGWTAVTNDVIAVLGSDVETDAELRARQSISSASSSRTVLEGLKGSIAEVSNVTRFIVYENDTKVVDSNGLPANSVTCVVEGGVTEEVAQAIYQKKGPGVYSNGTTSQTITDTYGNTVTIRFYRPTYLDIDVVINVKKLAGYTTDTRNSIKNAVYEYINSLSIGDDLSVSSLWGAALSANTVPTKPFFSITGLTGAKHTLTQGTADIVVAFNEVTRGNISYITINES